MKLFRRWKNLRLLCWFAVAKTASMSNPAVGFGVDFYGEESMQKMEKFLLRQEILCGRGAGESLQVDGTPAGRAV